MGFSVPHTYSGSESKANEGLADLVSGIGIHFGPESAGELARDLDADRQRDERGRILPSSGKQAKADAIRSAGLSTRTATRYEALVARGRANVDP
jgi:hypothetical protein